VSALRNDETARLEERAQPESIRRRDAEADRRDRLARERDIAAAARDRETEALDGGAILREPSGIALRVRASVNRQASASERKRAAEDRRQAALDRQALAHELTREGIDPLTGTMRRHVGLEAFERELARTQRSGERMVVAFVDVVGLKRINDTRGHAAGDAVLRDVCTAIRSHLRSYDLVARFGGDEFVCTLTGQDLTGARERFAQIAELLALGGLRSAISVGFAERGPDDTLASLIRRADLAMISTRGPRGAR
jgi:diguanylate cyclase (GGDEF)-like protein